MRRTRQCSEIARPDGRGGGRVAPETRSTRSGVCRARRQGFDGDSVAVLRDSEEISSGRTRVGGITLVGSDRGKGGRRAKARQAQGEAKTGPSRGQTQRVRARARVEQAEQQPSKARRRAVAEEPQPAGPAEQQARKAGRARSAAREGAPADAAIPPAPPVIPSSRRRAWREVHHASPRSVARSRAGVDLTHVAGPQARRITRTIC